MEQIIRLLPVHIRQKLADAGWQEGLEEIRIRIGQPMEFVYAGLLGYLSCTGEKVCICSGKQQYNAKNAYYRITGTDVAEMVNYISEYSLYAYQQEMRQGYLTVEGGHRIGIAGEMVKGEEHTAGMKHICFFNIRVAHEKKGCAAHVLPYLKDGTTIYNTLLVSEPGAGKTTYLRDCIRSLSDGESGYDGMKVCVIDERMEIAACHLGVPQNDVGIRTDVLSGCEKAKGMMLMLRAMSPQILAVDELGDEKDFEAVEQAAYSGVRILGTVHAKTIEELWNKPYLKKWTQQGVFERFVLLEKTRDGARKIRIFDGERKRVC